MIHYNHKSNAFSVKLVMQLCDGHCETGMLNLGEKFVDLGSFGKRLPFFLENGEHLLHGV